jgi:hypothetical protein
LNGNAIADMKKGYLCGRLCEGSLNCALKGYLLIRRQSGDMLSDYLLKGFQKAYGL